VEALAGLQKDVLVLQKNRWENLLRTNEEFERLTVLVSQAQMEYSLVRMQLDKTSAEERLAKVRRLSLVAQTVIEGRCTRAARDRYATRSQRSRHAWRSSRPQQRS
jgi:hypothetical protein